MTLTSSRISVARPLDPEDRARADIYAVLARLYADAPDAALLRALGGAERMAGDDNGIAGAWNRLLDASAAMDPEAAAQEYTDLFVGVGRSEVNLHASHWQTGFMMEKPLAELRAELTALGLARKGSVTTLEDHLGALCETMRLLVAGDEARRPASLDEQRNISRRWLFPWVFECCAAIEASSIANYYRRVAQLTSLFMALERDSLAME
jgi:TorA maturation chaperone TorD